MSSMSRSLLRKVEMEPQAEPTPQETYSIGNFWGKDAQSDTNNVWQYFGFEVYRNGTYVDIDYAVCKLCKIQLEYSCGSTTNLESHLKCVHPELPCGKSKHNEEEELGEEEEEEEEDDDEEIESSPQSPSPSSEIASCDSPSNTARITKALVAFVVHDLQPLRILESEPFLALMTRLSNGQYRMPPKSYVLKCELASLLETTKEQVLQKLCDAMSHCVTVEVWTYPSRDVHGASSNYLIVNAQLIDSDWSSQSYHLVNEALEGEILPQDVASILEVAQADWGLEDVVMVTDMNCAYLQTACRSINYMNIPCMGSALQAAVSAVFSQESVASLLTRVRGIVQHFQGKGQAACLLRRMQSVLNLPQVALALDCPLRWLSTVHMLNVVLNQKRAIFSALVSSSEAAETDGCDLVLTIQERGQLAALVEVITPFKVMADIFCGQDMPLASQILPCLSKLVTIRWTNPSIGSSGKSAFKAELRKAATSVLNAVYIDTKVNTFLRVASALDPRFKSLAFVDRALRRDTYETLRCEAMNLQASNGDPQASGEKYVRSGLGETYCITKEEDTGPWEITSASDPNDRTAAAGNGVDSSSNCARDVTLGLKAEPVDDGYGDNGVSTSTVVGESDEPLAKQRKLTAHPPSTSTAAEEGTPSGDKAASLEDFLSDVVNPTDASRSDVAGSPSVWSNWASKEVDRFLCEEDLRGNLAVSPLSWWESKAEVYPLLSVLARKYLCVAATSLPAARMFASKTDEVVWSRGRLEEEHLDMCLFLHHNNHVVQSLTK